MLCNQALRGTEVVSEPVLLHYCSEQGHNNTVMSSQYVFFSLSTFCISLTLSYTHTRAQSLTHACTRTHMSAHKHRLSHTHTHTHTHTLTTVLLVGSVGTVLVGVAVQGLGQTHTEVSTGELPQGAHRLCPAALCCYCGEKEGKSKSPAFTLSLTHTHTHTHTLTHSLTHTLTHTHTHAHTHLHTHTLSHTNTLTHAHTHSLTRERDKEERAHEGGLERRERE